jgi:superfamily I DNA/RNA helicase
LPDFRFPGIVDKIRKFCQCDPKSADVVFSTVHKSKGLEWQSVILIDDFREIPGGSEDMLYINIIRSERDNL